MRATTKRINALRGCKQFRLVLVQFQSPFEHKNRELFIEPSLRGDVFQWREGCVASRIKRCRAILSALKTSEHYAGSQLKIVVFPEYTIPKECHEDDFFQRHAKEHNCIIIPGTYYEDVEQNLRRNNVCKIYLPDEKVICLVKGRPAEEEKTAVITAKDQSNVVHFVGNNEILGEFSISIFICRDYLVPFCLSTSGQNQKLIADWRRPGVNIVTMCSSQMKLFESQAGLDVRALLKEDAHRAAAFCNVAGDGIEGDTVVGSAILGPRKSAGFDGGDVIESLPGDKEAILVADVFLDSKEFASSHTKPPTKRWHPVRNASTQGISYLSDGATGDLTVKLETLRGAALAERGVWHPAFLKHMKKKIVIHLFRTHHLTKFIKAIENGEIRNVSAFIVEGIYDIMIRHYEDTDTRTTAFNPPISAVGDERFRGFFKAFHRLKVDPEDIIKFRTVPIKRDAKGIAEWDSQWKQIAKAMPWPQWDPRRREITEKVSLLSRNWQDSRIDDAAREKLSVFFLNKRETVSSTTSYTTGRNQNRQKFVLIALGNDATATEISTFQERVVNQRLLEYPEVRSIYRLHQDESVQSKPHRVPEGGVRIEDVDFHYWLDISAPPYRIVEIITEVTNVGDELGLECGARTMEVQDYLLLESVEGLHATDFANEGTRFLAATLKIGDDVGSGVTPEGWKRVDIFFRTCSNAWNDQHMPPSEARLEYVEMFKEKITEFYGYLFWGNAAFVDLEKRRTRLINAAGAWHELFKILEDQLAKAVTGHVKSTSGKDIEAHLTDVCKVPKEALAFVRDDAAKQFIMLTDKDPSFDYLPKAQFVEVRRTFESFRDFRNKVGAHGLNSATFLDVFPKEGEPVWSPLQMITFTAGLIGLCRDAGICLEKIASRT